MRILLLGRQKVLLISQMKQYNARCCLEKYVERVATIMVEGPELTGYTIQRIADKHGCGA